MSQVNQVNRAENWKSVYEAFQQVNFTAWDYTSIKKSLIDYLKLYYAEEDFNDYIETSELIPIIETFAYVGELLAYRTDMNAHENILTDAGRKDSVLRLVKLISYNASRNIPARGLVKLTSVSTTETIFDSRGVELTNKIITWNDPNNPSWKDQFLIVMNRIMNQNFGTVLPSDRVQVQDVVFELYGLNNTPVNNNVLKYNVNVGGQSYPMELVSSQLNSGGPYEQRPELNLQINVLYLSDGLGDTSDNTGFFFFTKQGTLQRTLTTFDGITPNQTYDIAINNSNNIDVWVNNINSDGSIIVGSGATTQRLGEWIQVDIANSQNIIFNTNPNSNKYEIETLDNDQFRLIFGDGNFAAIPSGQFEIWSRNSANLDLVIPANTIQNIGTNLQYSDTSGKNQTFSLTISLVDSIQNAAPTEDIEHIRRIAPAVYYTQSRMVNGRDYNEFPLQDNSILKLRTINRTFAGDSKYIAWHDPREYYDNVKIFSDDGVIYFNEFNDQTRVPQSSLPQPDFGANISLTTALIFNYIQPLLSTEDFYIKSILKGALPRLIRTTFTTAETMLIKSALSTAANQNPKTVYLSYDINSNLWSVSLNDTGDWWISVSSGTDNFWTISLLGVRVILHSTGTNFWVTNGNYKTITYDTLNPNYDQIAILAANISPQGTVLTTNYLLNVLNQMVIEVGENKGLNSINDLILLPADDNGDGVPDFVNLGYIVGPNSYVYFNRLCTDVCDWIYQPATSINLAAYASDQSNNTGLWKRENGTDNVNFLWMHRTPRYHLVDPAASNIMDAYVVTRGYYTALRSWLNGTADLPPTLPTPFELKNSYNYLLESKMISDTVILHPGKIKLLFGPFADQKLQVSFKVVKSTSTNMTNNQIKTAIIDAINAYFDISMWDFGQSFYFTEMSTYIQTQLSTVVKSIVLVPTYNNQIFGDMFQVYANEDEILQPSLSVDIIDIVDSLNPSILRQF